MKFRILAAPALLIALAIGGNEATAQQKNGNGNGENRSVLSVTQDTWDGETHVDFIEDGHRYKIRLKGSTILEMYLDEKKVPSEDFAKYEPKVKKILEQIEKDREQARKDREQADRDREQAMKDRAQAQKDREQAERDREQARKDRDQAMRERENINELRQRANKDREQVDLDRKQAEKDRAQANKDRAQAEEDRKQAMKDREQAMKDRAQAEEDRKLFESMIDELIKENVVESRAALTSLEFDDKELIINGKKQPDNIHARFKEKYFKGKHHRIQYRNSGEIRNMSFN